MWDIGLDDGRTEPQSTQYTGQDDTSWDTRERGGERLECVGGEGRGGEGGEEMGGEGKGGWEGR